MHLLQEHVLGDLYRRVGDARQQVLADGLRNRPPLVEGLGTLGEKRGGRRKHSRALGEHNPVVPVALFMGCRIGLQIVEEFGYLRNGYRGAIDVNNAAKEIAQAADPALNDRIVAGVPVELKIEPGREIGLGVARQGCRNGVVRLAIEIVYARVRILYAAAQLLVCGELLTLREVYSTLTFRLDASGLRGIGRLAKDFDVASGEQNARHRAKHIALSELGGVRHLIHLAAVDAEAEIRKAKHHAVADAADHVFAERVDVFAYAGIDKPAVAPDGLHELFKAGVALGHASGIRPLDGGRPLCAETRHLERVVFTVGIGSHLGLGASVNFAALREGNVNLPADIGHFYAGREHARSANLRLKPGPLDVDADQGIRPDAEGHRPAAAGADGRFKLFAEGGGGLPLLLLDAGVVVADAVVRQVRKARCVGSGVANGNGLEQPFRVLIGVDRAEDASRDGVKLIVLMLKGLVGFGRYHRPAET